MANFCSNCGEELKQDDKFCPSCGLSTEASLNNKAGEQKQGPGVIGYWEAKEIDTGDDYGSNIKGSLALTQQEIIFFRYAWLSKKPKERRRISILKIKSIVRTPIFNIITISHNKAPERSGAWRRFFSKRKISYKIKNWQSFVDNIKKINPSIKIKT